VTTSRFGPHIGLGFAVSIAVFVADQASKLWILRGLELRPGDRLELTPFLDFALTYNRGISYGLFQQESESGRWVLILLTLVATVLFTFWMTRTHSRLVAVALALLVGGAAGNVLDRMVYGAVVDFVSLHAFGWRWYVFNLADASIVAGVLGLMYDAVSGSVTKSPPSGRS
jgi:signal peptidase II